MRIRRPESILCSSLLIADCRPIEDGHIPEIWGHSWSKPRVLSNDIPHASGSATGQVAGMEAGLVQDSLSLSPQGLMTTHLASSETPWDTFGANALSQSTVAGLILSPLRLENHEIQTLMNSVIPEPRARGIENGHIFESWEHSNAKFSVPLNGIQCASGSANGPITGTNAGLVEEFPGRRLQALTTTYMTLSEIPWGTNNAYELAEPNWSDLIRSPPRSENYEFQTMMDPAISQPGQISSGAKRKANDFGVSDFSTEYDLFYSWDSNPITESSKEARLSASPSNIGLVSASHLNPRSENQWNQGFESESPAIMRPKGNYEEYNFEAGWSGTPNSPSKRFRSLSGKFIATEMGKNYLMDDAPTIDPQSSLKRLNFDLEAFGLNKRKIMQDPVQNQIQRLILANPEMRFQFSGENAQALKGIHRFWKKIRKLTAQQAKAGSPQIYPYLGRERMGFVQKTREEFYLRIAVWKAHWLKHKNIDFDKRLMRIESFGFPNAKFLYALFLFCVEMIGQIIPRSPLHQGELLEDAVDLELACELFDKYARAVMTVISHPEAPLLADDMKIKWQEPVEGLDLKAIKRIISQIKKGPKYQQINQVWLFLNLWSKKYKKSLTLDEKSDFPNQLKNFFNFVFCLTVDNLSKRYEYLVSDAKVE